MAPKRKAVDTASLDSSAPKRKPNGIKGITVAQKSNDPLRDKLLATLRSSGLTGSIESKIVFAHTGIYVRDVLFGWVGQGTSFAIRCNNSQQKKICEKHGCAVVTSHGHKENNYFSVPVLVQSNAAALRALAEDVTAAAPAKKTKNAKK